MALRSTLCIWLLAVGLATASAAGEGVPVETLDGERANLGDFLSQDKWTLVMVWTTYCGVCRTQYPLISAFHREHAQHDAVVLGVSLDGYGQADVIKAYQSEHEFNFPSVMTTVEAFADRYERTTGADFTGTPTYLLFDPTGKLRGFLDGPVTIAAIEKFIAK